MRVCRNAKRSIVEYQVTRRGKERERKGWMAKDRIVWLLPHDEAMVVEAKLQVRGMASATERGAEKWRQSSLPPRVLFP
jgi:hypothetical protein